MRYKFTAILMALICLILSCNTAYARDGVDEETPLDVQIAANKYGEQYDICPELLEAIMYYESRYTVDAENGPCKGIMQINAAYYTDRMKKFGITDYWDLENNILLATDYLAELFKEYEDVGIVLGVYHGESNAVSRGKEGNLSNYVKKIIDKASELERIHGK